MELERREKPELYEEAEAAELAEGAAEPDVEIIGEGASERRFNIASLIFGTLLVAAGLLVFHWTRWTIALASGGACRPGSEAFYSVCYSPLGEFLLGPGLFFGATVAAGVEGLRGRRYYGWLWVAITLLAAPLVAKGLEIWVLAGGR